MHCFYCKILVGVIGFEPTTSRPPDECATGLRHTPTSYPVDRVYNWVHPPGQ